MIWHYAKQTLAGLAIIAIAGLGIVAVTTRAQHGQLLSVQTGSMVPNLNKGDLVGVTRVSASSLKVGDIITFINPKDKKSTITHRITELPNAAHPGQVITKGDANPAADQAHPVSQIIGKVGWSVPYAGKAIDFVRKPIGLIALIYVPALLVIISELKRLAKHYETQKPYIAPIHEKPNPEPTWLDRAVTGMGFVFVVAVMTLLGSLISVRADLLSTAKLTGNTISATKPDTSHIVIKELCLRCSHSNTSTAAQRPIIYLYNPTKTRINLQGWTLRDNSGTIITIGSKKLNKNATYVLRPYLPSGGLKGLQYAGDRLVLYDAQGNKVDGLSWGSDTTELNPSIQGVTPGTHIIRKDKKVDTDKATDWRLRDTRCYGEPRSPHGDEEGDDGDGEQEGDYDTTNQSLIPQTAPSFTIEERSDD